MIKKFKYAEVITHNGDYEILILDEINDNTWNNQLEDVTLTFKNNLLDIKGKRVIFKLIKEKGETFPKYIITDKREPFHIILSNFKVIING